MAYWQQVHETAVTRTMGVLNLHRTGIFAVAIVNALAAAIFMWWDVADKTLTVVVTVGLWVASWVIVYLYQFFTAPPRLAAESGARIKGLEEEISKRGARVKAVQSLIDLY